jgi:alpha-1,2-mannosyltransferase
VHTPKISRLIWIVGLAVAGILLAQTWARAARPGGIDLTTYLEASRAIMRGENPYTLDLAFPYLYPPFLAFAVIPLTLMPNMIALVIWSVASIWALVWAIRETLVTVEPDLQERDLTPLLAALLSVGFPIVQNNVRNGQVNFIVLALCIYALRLFLHKQSGACAVAWGTAVAIKLMPAILIVFCLIRRRIREVVGAMALAAVLCVVPVVVAGRSLLMFQADYIKRLMRGELSPTAADSLNFGAGGVLGTLGLPRSSWWILIVVAVFGVVVAWAVDRPEPATAGRTVRAFTAYLAAILLVSPKSEVHHLAFALPAAAIVAAEWWYGLGRSTRLSRWFGGFALAGYLAALAWRPVAGTALFVSISMLIAAVMASGHAPYGASAVARED